MRGLGIEISLNGLFGEQSLPVELHQHQLRVAGKSLQVLALSQGLILDPTYGPPIIALCIAQLPTLAQGGDRARQEQVETGQEAGEADDPREAVPVLPRVVRSGSIPWLVRSRPPLHAHGP